MVLLLELAIRNSRTSSDPAANDTLPFRFPLGRSLHKAFLIYDEPIVTSHHPILFYFVRFVSLYRSPCAVAEPEGCADRLGGIRDGKYGALPSWLSLLRDAKIRELFSLPRIRLEADGPAIAVALPTLLYARVSNCSRQLTGAAQV